jgi:hypothetical protein
MLEQDQKMHQTTSGKPFVAHPIPPAPPKQKRTWMYITGAAVLVIALGAWAIVHFSGPAEPRLNESTVTLVKFLTSGKFEGLGYDKQRQYYKVFDDRSKELDKELKDNHITESEYRAAIEAAWLGKHINHVEKYYSLPQGEQRTEFVNKLVAKKLKKDAKEKSTAKPTDEQDFDTKVDETAAEFKVESWPTVVREQWKTFHQSYHDQKKAAEKAEKSATKPAAGK